MAYEEVTQTFADLLGISVGTAVVLIVIISIWSLVWKGFALWKSSKKNQLIWFIALLIINTFGILEILYIYVFSKMGGKKSKKEKSLTKEEKTKSKKKK